MKQYKVGARKLVAVMKLMRYKCEHVADILQVSDSMVNKMKVGLRGITDEQLQQLVDHPMPVINLSKL